MVITWLGTEPEKPSILLNSHMDVVPVFEVCMITLMSDLMITLMSHLMITLPSQMLHRTLLFSLINNFFCSLL